MKNLWLQLYYNYCYTYTKLTVTILPSLYLTFENIFKFVVLL